MGQGRTKIGRSEERERESEEKLATHTRTAGKSMQPHNTARRAKPAATMSSGGGKETSGRDCGPEVGRRRGEVKGDRQFKVRDQGCSLAGSSGGCGSAC